MAIKKPKEIWPPLPRDRAKWPFVSENGSPLEPDKPADKLAERERADARKDPKQESLF